jgi:hypothetical protein
MNKIIIAKQYLDKAHELRRCVEILDKVDTVYENILHTKIERLNEELANLEDNNPFLVDIINILEKE